ncbi:Broad specificity phosphatase PhoE [Amycolatopsis arida]|uniref:Broad specificity phosphatase PhoE n=1 Tax=Amycolatopsis arida TaxID=587909 RepID=A0A1I5KVJ3_9PSEU|nr:histidine phosphatase family protein [Amycolatopsis arida]TDX85855.1 broad specificity phosphatase PhoE [Amycolatopsis arida]SFO89065.1 Broad specificity phosphatase PhoE [Amycolatopsis arida]
MGAIYLVRHGQASFGAADYDVLSDRGREQAVAVGAELRRRRVRLAEARCGSMARQRGTAEAALAELRSGLVAKEDPRWNEYDHLDVLDAYGGSMPGEDPRAFQRALDAALTCWVDAGATSACAESWPSFTTRVREALDDVVGALGRGEHAVVFTSGGVIAALGAQLLGAPEAFPRLSRVAANASITKVVSGRGGLSLVSFNEHAHFDGDAGELLSYR